MTYRPFVHSRKVWMFICVMELPILWLSGLSYRAPSKDWTPEASASVYKATVLLTKKLDQYHNYIYRVKQDAIEEAEQIQDISKYTRL